MAARVGLHEHRAGLAADLCVVGRLEAAQARVVDADVAEQVRRQLLVRIEPAILLHETDAVEVQRRHAPGLLRRHLTFDVRERARLAELRRSAHRARPACSRPAPAERLGHAARVLDGRRHRVITESASTLVASTRPFRSRMSPRLRGSGHRPALLVGRPRDEIARGGTTCRKTRRHSIAAIHRPRKTKATVRPPPQRLAPVCDDRFSHAGSPLRDDGLGRRFGFARPVRSRSPRPVRARPGAAGRSRASRCAWAIAASRSRGAAGASALPPRPSPAASPRPDSRAAAARSAARPRTAARATNSPAIADRFPELALPRLVHLADDGVVPDVFLDRVLEGFGHDLRQPLRRAQLRASRARVAPYFVLVRHDRLLRQHLQHGGVWPCASARSVCFTMRSSSEWNVMTTSRAPTRSRRAAASRNRSSPSSSRFTQMRSAWNVRVAGSMRWYPRVGNGPANDRRQPAGRVDRRLAPRRDERARDAPREALFAVGVNRVGQLLLGAAGDQVGGRRRRPRDPSACRAARRAGS